MILPYKDIELSESYTIRRFDSDIDPIELMWHRDLEDRLIKPLSDNDWKIQLDECLPINIDKHIFIPKLVWHRAIKGTTNLLIKIYKL